jgi:hypothetical protein
MCGNGPDLEPIYTEVVYMACTLSLDSVVGSWREGRLKMRRSVSQFVESVNFSAGPYDVGFLAATRLAFPKSPLHTDSIGLCFFDSRHPALLPWPAFWKPWRRLP